MGLLSFLFSDDKEQRIRTLEGTIETHKKLIENERKTMERYRIAKAAQHYQENGKRKIAVFQETIKRSKAELARLKKK